MREIEASSAATPYIADAWFAAGRVCEDAFADPARALALYERIVRELPDARVSTAAARRAEALRAQVGAGGEHAARATELARLIAEVDRIAPAEVERRARALADAPWPGAPEAALWLAEWMRRSDRLAEAQRHYAEVAARWPGTPHAVVAIRGGAGNALAAGDWSLAEQLARQLPILEAADGVLQEELLDAAARGRRRDRWYAISWLAIAGALAILLGSLAEAWLRPPRARRRWPRPPFELLYIAPVAAVLVGVALTAHQSIAPAVLALTAGGLVFATISGAALDLLRHHGRPLRRRAVAHVLVCLLATIALLYIVLMHDHLIDLVIETIRFGPER
ncbi:MAG: hypothetical protein ACTHU0_09920 [Kofleriaceae bacterium]